MLDVQPNTTLQESLEQAAQHHHAGRHAEAEAIYRHLVAQYPENADVHYNLGVVLNGRGKQAEAVAAYQKALALRPGFMSAGINLGNLLHQAGQPAQAVEVYIRTLAENRKDFAMIHNSLATSLQETGRLDESLACFARSMAIQPNDPTSSSNRLCSLHFHPAYDPAALCREARLWNDRFARPLRGEIPIHVNDRSPDRRLRIGYVSPDFRRHCQSLFTPPLMAHHDRSSFEIVCYSAVTAPDEVTTRLQRYGHVWRDIAGLSDAQAAILIQQDRIDILVDLTLHMAGNRLGVFARKPAPIQVTWLGYPGTTGLDAMDYRLTDPRLDPVDTRESEIRNPKSEIRTNDQNPNVPISNDVQNTHGRLSHLGIGSLGIDSDFEFRISKFSTQEPFYSERSIRLPDTFWCYDPSQLDEVDGASLLQPSPAPARPAGYVTFGCLNNFAKVNDQTLALWGRVMAVVPHSRFLLRVAQGPQRRRVVQMLGVPPERVEMVPSQSRKQYMETYQRIDFCLDTLPYNGHTTNLDAMWMGVPVVTRVGRTVVGRAGWSQLHNLQLTELAAWDDEQFVKIATALAGDLDRLDHLRATLRNRMKNLPLMDGPRFARNVEAAYRRMWQAWCKHG